MKIRALIVEDEPLAADLLRTMLSRAADVEIVGECENGVDALSSILDLKPHLVFLDVQIPDLDGFGVLDAVRDAGAALPVIVFVTAYDRYALRAFDVHAIDYLLKPYDPERFAAALERARGQLMRRELEELNARVVELLGEVRSTRKSYLERFVVQSSERVYFVAAGEVDWIEAAANYLQLHAGKNVHQVRATMASIEQRLDPRQFMRISRSAIVNLAKVRELQPWFHGEYRVILRDGAALTLSRTYKDRLPALLGEPPRAG
jgi:two-component system LytT family response regulator